MAPATGLSTLTTINFANNSQLQTIGPKAFLGCSNLTAVNLPNSTNTIGAAAFQNCTNLQTINLKGVSYIGDAAFNNAFIAQNNALATGDAVTLDLTSAQYIGVGAFDSSVWTSSTTNSQQTPPVQVLPGTTGTTTVTVTQTKNLSKISTVSFSKPLTTLSSYAFNGANYLKSVDLSGCTSLASIGNNAFSSTDNLADVKFSNTISSIGNSAFSGAKLTNTLTFNTKDNLTIGTNAFDTQQLTTIDFSNVTGNITIGNNAFSGANQNTTLTTLTLPAVPTDNAAIQQIVMIGQSAFGNCTALKLPGLTEGADAANYSLPANIGYMGQNAFSTATLATIEKGYSYNPSFDITNEWNNVADGLFAGVTNGSTYFGPLKGNNNTSLTSVDLSNTNIQALNYGNVSQLGVTNPSSSSIPYQGTFNNASNLKEITLPASCNQFGIAAFSDYSATQYGAFSNCSSLQKLNFKKFTLNDKDAEGNALTGFDQITQATWVQVANIMNALMYFGQQNITAVAPDGAGTDQTITNQTQMDGITYTVNANPVADGGTWFANGQQANTAFNKFGNHFDSILGITTNGYNYPINVYPAGSYGYSVEAAEGAPGSRADATPVTVNYPAGLGTSVSANFKDSNSPSGNITSSTTNSVTFGSANPNEALTLGSATGGNNTLVAQNGVLNNQTTADGNLYLTIPGSSITNATGTLTLTADSTRPQSVWYTVSASGTVGADSDTTATQVPYTPTTDESNNIFAITANKIPGATNTGNGGYGYGMGNASGSSSLANSNTYTTTTCGNPNGNSANTYGQPFAALSTTLKTDASSSSSTNITISQNYLPLGITANVKDAYFNHNGIIWHYHNGFAAKDNDGIYITGYVNAYIGGSIQAQGNGIGGLAYGVEPNNSEDGTGASALSNSNSLTAGVYNNGAGLTSVGGTPFKKSDFGFQSSSQIIRDNKNPTINLFGGKTGTGNFELNNKNNGPKGLTVTLTLVPGTQTSNR